MGACSHLQQMQHHVERPNDVRPDLHSQGKTLYYRYIVAGSGRFYHDEGYLVQLRSDLIGHHDRLHGQSLREGEHLALVMGYDKTGRGV